jgi:ABC-type multidrug transport system permease subunit
VFLLFGFLSTLVISNTLRTLGHVTRSVYQALAPYALIVTAMVLYTGFVLPVRDMQGWLRWLERLDPISYAYQSLVINELRGRRFECNAFVPAYEDATSDQRTCGTRGGAPGSTFVDGNDYIRTQLGYDPGNIWRSAHSLKNIDFDHKLTTITCTGTSVFSLPLLWRL